MLQTKTFSPVISIADKTSWIIISRGNWGTELRAGSAGLNFMWTFSSLMIFSLKGHAFLWWILLPRSQCRQWHSELYYKHPPFLRLPNPRITPSIRTHKNRRRQTSFQYFSLAPVFTFFRRRSGEWYLHMHALNHKHSAMKCIQSKKCSQTTFSQIHCSLTHERASVYARRAPGGIQRRPGEPYGPVKSLPALPLCCYNTDYDNSAPRDPHLGHLNRCDALLSLYGARGHLRGGHMGDKE